MPKTTQSFGSRLRSLRRGRGLSMPELAERAGLANRHVIYQYESGRRQPGWDVIQRLAAALEVSTEDFRGG